MNKELDKYLCDKYPKIFANRNNPKSFFKFGFECDDGWFFLIDGLCGAIQNHIDNPAYIPKFGNGIKQIYNTVVWNHVIYPVVSKTNSKNNISKFYNWCQKYLCFDIRYKKPKVNPCSQVVAAQVKEKFSGLRFYYEGGDDHIAALISLSEGLSYRICETCGNMNHEVGRNDDGWIRTTCKLHATNKKDFKVNDTKATKIFTEINKKSKNGTNR